MSLSVIWFSGFCRDLFGFCICGNIIFILSYLWKLCFNFCFRLFDLNWMVF